jgi:ABC-type uncharacterized transport system fused permease/ATPase subunit
VRRAAKVDANHGEIVAALRAHGCKVADLSGVGKGVPDILVWIPAWNRWVLIEIKVPGEKLNERQEKWHAEYRGCMVFVVTSAEEAIAAVQHFEG